MRDLPHINETFIPDANIMLITRDVSELHMRVSFKPYASTGLQHSLFLYMYFCLCSHSHKGDQCIHLTSNILLYFDCNFNLYLLDSCL
jgi:hypothetical protein